MSAVRTIEESWHKLREHMVEQRYTDQQIAIAAQSFDVGVETGKDNAAVNADLVAACQRALSHYESIRGDKEDTALMSNLRSALRKAGAA